jgi:plastocyanin
MNASVLAAITVHRVRQRRIHMRPTFCATALAVCAIAAATAAAPADQAPVTYLPNAQNSRIVTVTRTGQPMARMIVQTHGAAIKETGPKETVARFGEVYAFSPATIIVHRDEATLIEFWNLQPDDDHDFMLMDSRLEVMMKVMLPMLRKTSYIFTFHQDGLFNFVCTMHQPAMNGQILVVPPAPR